MSELRLIRMPYSSAGCARGGPGPSGPWIRRDHALALTGTGPDGELRVYRDTAAGIELDAST